MDTISVVGLGKLGLPLAAAIASRGMSVIGYDNDPSKIRAIYQNNLPSEPFLEEFIHKYRDRLEFVQDLEKIRKSFLTFVVVPTPSLANGDFSLRYAEAALKRLGNFLRSKNNFHMICLVSTVLPGSMEKLSGVLEAGSGKKCGKDFGFCYNPAFIALGNVIHNFLQPDFVLIGESDKKSGDYLEVFYERFCAKPAPIHRMNFVNAELAKISVNTFITMKISFGNMLARMAERIPGAHADIITEAIGSDSRIGRPYLKGALGYGGPCFPRDNKAFSYVARRIGLKAYASEATDKVNRLQSDLLARFVLSQAAPNDTVCILGLSYKPDTDVIEESQGIALAKILLKHKRRLILYDPAAMEPARALLKGEEVSFARSLSEALQESDVIMIATPWKDFTQWKHADLLSRNGHPKKLIDPWRMIWPKKRSNGFEYLPLGVSLDEARKAAKI